MKIPVVNEQDEIIWYKERNEIEQEDIYRVSCLWVVNELWETLLTQRASTKKHDPDKRTIAVSGTVEEWESYEDNIIKETQEEIWVTINNPLLLIKQKVTWEHNFFVSIFFKVLLKDTKFSFDLREVQNFQRLSKEKIDEWLVNFPEELHPSFDTLWKIVHEKLRELNLI